MCLQSQHSYSKVCGRDGRTPRSPEPEGLAHSESHTRRGSSQRAGDPHLSCPLTSMCTPGGKCICTNTGTHRDVFERTEWTHEGETEQDIVFRTLDFLKGNKPGEPSNVLEHNLEVSRPQTTKGEPYNFTALKIT